MKCYGMTASKLLNVIESLHAGASVRFMTSGRLVRVRRSVLTDGFTVQFLPEEECARWAPTIYVGGFAPDEKGEDLDMYHRRSNGEPRGFIGVLPMTDVRVLCIEGVKE